MSSQVTWPLQQVREKEEQVGELVELVVREVLGLQVEKGKQEDFGGQHGSLLLVHIQAPKLPEESYERQSARIPLAKRNCSPVTKTTDEHLKPEEVRM